MSQILSVIEPNWNVKIQYIKHVFYSFAEFRLRYRNSFKLTLKIVPTLSVACAVKSAALSTTRDGERDPSEIPSICQILSPFLYHASEIFFFFLRTLEIFQSIKIVLENISFILQEIVI